jgi:hypothetical protein
MMAGIGVRDMEVIVIVKTERYRTVQYNADGPVDGHGHEAAGGFKSCKNGSWTVRIIWFRVKICELKYRHQVSNSFSAEERRVR